jgi:hypothetical protein
LTEAWLRPETTARLLLVDLALRSYYAEHGRWPDGLEELGSDYLADMPDDPHSSRPLIYRRTADGFLLYSIGFDGQDNGGTFGSPTDYNNAQHRNQAGLDLDLETIIWPK